MEAFVAVATAQGDDSQLSTPSSLDVTSPFTTSYRSSALPANNNKTSSNNNSSPTTPPTSQNNNKVGKAQLLSAAIDSGDRSRSNNNSTTNFAHLLSSHHLHPSVTSVLSRRDLLDNGHYWKYLVGDAGAALAAAAAINSGNINCGNINSNKMVPQEPAPTATGNECAVSKTPSPSGDQINDSSLKNNSRTKLGPESVGGDGFTVPNSRKSSSVVGMGGGGPIAPSLSTGSDVEHFDGRIVYNPDGSAYIIEDSEMSEEDGSLDVPHLEGCIVDGRGVSLSQIPPIPPIASAFYVSRNPALYSALYGQAYSSLLTEKKIVPDIPIMHSYRVYTVRDNKSGDKDSSAAVDEEDDEEEEGEDSMDEEESEAEGEERQPRRRRPPKSRVKGGQRFGSVGSSISTAAALECSSVPIKPILMCFICKLSFGYTKSFVGHAMGDHSLILTDQEKDILNQRNVSAIIQAVGKTKDPLISFLEPMGNSIAGGVNFANRERDSASVPIPNLRSVINRLNDLPLHQQLASAKLYAGRVEDENSGNSNTAMNLSGVNRDISPQRLLFSPRAEPEIPQSPQISSISPMSKINVNVNMAAGLNLGVGVDLTRKSPNSGRSSVSPETSISPLPLSSTPNPGQHGQGTVSSPNGSQFTNSNNGNGPGAPPNFMTGTTIGVCPEHMNGRPSGVDCQKCELILNSSRMGALGSLHTRNSCKTLKCPKCNWHYKYQETLEIHMKEKHPDNETSCIYCIAGQPHPRLARGETYTCGYKPYRCEVCNYSTTTKGNLSIHMQSDKHLNNMQELQNGGVPPPESLHQSVQQSSGPHKNLSGMSPSASGHGHGSSGAGGNGGGGGMIGNNNNSGSAGPQSNPKPKPTFRCDVCNYETNVARNLRIHMTSEKHTHNMMVLQQNVKHMQHLSALQAQAQAQSPFDPTTAALLQFHPSLAGLAAGAGVGGDKPAAHTEAALADMAYNQALLIQMMTGGQLPPHIPPELAPHMDLGLNPDTMEPPPEPPDPNPNHLFQCCVCTSFHTDSLEALSHHLTQDRTKLREQEILVLVAGNYMCKLCSYKTNLKANFQLHCKTDKHLQRLQHVNHIKEGGTRNEWKLKYLSMSNPIQVRCNACDYYTNSAHKLQLHAAHQRHEISVLIFRHIQSQENLVHEDARIFACALCGFTSRVKLQLLQHTRSLKHLQLEQLHSLQRRAEGKDGQPDLSQVFRVLEQPDSDSPGPTTNHHHQHHHPHHNNSSDISPNFYNNDQDAKEIKKEESRSQQQRSSVLKNALEKEGGDLSDLSCPYCTFVAESESRLQSHVTSKHSGSDLSFSRPRTTSNSSPDSKAEISGISSNVGTGAMTMTMTCPLCQDPCLDRQNLETHVMQVHSVNAEGLQRLLLLVNQSHWLNTTPTTNTTTSSRSAGNQSSSSADLKSDSNDEGEKDKLSESEEGGSDVEEFRCSTCSKCFRVLDELCSHQNELGHLEIKQTPGGPGYLCWKKGCNQYFPTAPSLQMHFREIHAARNTGTVKGHSMAVSEKHVYKYRCNQCSLAFKTMEKLQLHSQYHAIRDASKCCLCGRSFRSLLALQKHVETSHTELSEDELQQFKHSIATNPLLLAGLTGQVLDPAMTELLKKESAREEQQLQLQEQLMMEEEQRSLIGESGDPDGDGDGDSNDNDSTGNSGSGKDQQQLFEDYLNTQAMAEDSYNDPNRKYKCHRCKVAFTRQSYLTSHNKTLLHRKGEKLSYPMEKYLDPNRPYKCEVCKESFTQKNILLVHYNSVSHLHKLKRAMQEQQHFLTQVGGNGSGGNSQLSMSQSPLMSPVSSSGGTTKLTPSTMNSDQQQNTNQRQSTSSTSLTDDEDKKPFKCNICKVAYSQGSTLDIHMRSVLHQTRASKLQELAMTGQIDLSKPLIEQPEAQKLVDQHKKLMAEMLSPTMNSLSNSNSKSDMQLQQSGLSFSTPARSSSPLSHSHSQNSSPQNASISPAAINSSSSPSISGNYSCPRCSAICGSQEQLIQHQHLYCMFQNPLSMFPPLPSPNSTSTPNTSMLAGLRGESQSQGQGVSVSNIHISPAESPVPITGGTEEGYQRFVMPGRKSSQLYKHILESYGFEIVMQFNEYHQKRLTKRCEEDEEMPSMDEQQILSEFPELARSTCPYCKKVFSSVWILKAHCEEIHKDIVSMEILENFADDFRNAYAQKLEVAAAAANEEIEKESGLVMELEMRDASKGSSGIELVVNNPTAPSTPTASTTPASSADSVTCGSNNNTSAASSGGGATGGQHSNIPMALAQHMNEVQNAIMAASQLHQFNPMLNPMMMAMGLPFNMNALAAMNLQPPLVSMMMPPPFDHMNSMGQNQGNSSTGSLFNQQMEHTAIAKQQQQQLQHLQQQQQAQQQQQQQGPNSGNSQQKRARTRITDEQLKILRAHFDINNSPSEEQIQQMAQQSGLPPKVIKHWFRNTLFKERQRNKDSPYNFSNPPSTTLNLEEYEKTGETKVKALDPEELKLYQVPILAAPVKKEGGGNRKLSQSQQQQQQQQQQLQQQQQQQQQSLSLNLNLNTHLSNAFQHHLDHGGNFHLLGFGDGKSSGREDIDGHSHEEISETESKSEDERPRKRAPPSKGGAGGGGGGGHSNSKSHKSAAAAAARAANLAAMTVPETNSSSSPSSSLTLSSLITSHMTPLDGGNSHSQQAMLPPPMLSSAAATAAVAANTSNFATPISTVPNSSLLSLASPVSLASPAGSIGRPESSSMTTPPLSNCGSQSGMSSGKRANRTRFTDYQIKVLQEFFENNAYPKDDDLEYLSKLLGLSPRVIVVWFQNARQKARKVYENQPPVDTTTDESTGRFQRTPGLNYQCKKCLLVFQRYYELIRHQKTHCFKEEDAKRSAQAQAAAAQVAAAMSSDDSNSSHMTDNSGLTSSCGPSPSAAVALGNSNNSNQSAASAAALYNAEMKSQQLQGSNSSQDETFQCDKCNLVFSRFELWREHQLVHIMNPNLFPQFSPESPFGILQQHAHQQQQQAQQQAQQQQQQVQIKVEQKDPMQQQQQHQQSHSAASSTAGDATAKRKWSADEYTDDDKDEQPRDKRLRTTILPEQLDYLYQKYQIESNPSRKMLETIAREVGLKKRVVQVWFQNTRARERKGQFRAHAQVINKRCPLCPALFKVKSALETHLAAKHADQYSKGEINIDALPDEEFIEGPSSPILGDNTKVPISFGNANTNSLGAPPSTSPSPNIMTPFLHSLSTHAELESSLKKLYEESLKRYAAEVQHQHHSIVGGGPASHNGRPDSVQTPTDLRLVKTELSSPPSGENMRGFSGGPGEFPLDLSKPVDLSRALATKSETMDSMDTHDYLSDGDDFDVRSHDSNPNSPASSTGSTQRPTCGGGGPSANNNSSSAGSTSGGGKRFRTQMSSLQVKVMKNLFADYKTPTMAECEMLGREIGLAKRVIQVWFQNARAKEKKAKLALQKSQGLSSTTAPDLTPADKLPEECRLCSFKYSHKYSIQDHIFTRKHIDTVKAFIESMGKCKSGNKVSRNGEGHAQGQVQSHESSTTSIEQQQQQQQLLQQLHLLQFSTSNNTSGNNNNNITERPPPSVSIATEVPITTNTPTPEDQLSFLQLYGLGAATPTGFGQPIMAASSGRVKTNTAQNRKPKVQNRKMATAKDASAFDDIDAEKFEGGDNEQQHCQNILQSLNIFPRNTVAVNSNSNPEANLMSGTSTNHNTCNFIDNKLTPGDLGVMHRTSSPSAGIRSEMEYVVQKIAALARATSVDESTDSNANIRFGNSE